MGDGMNRGGMANRGRGQGEGRGRGRGENRGPRGFGKVDITED